MEIIIQGKRDFRERTIRRGVLKPCAYNAFQCEFRQADMGVILNVGIIIKSERALQGIGVEQDNEEGEREEYQEFKRSRKDFRDKQNALKR